LPDPYPSITPRNIKKEEAKGKKEEEEKREKDGIKMFIRDRQGKKKEKRTNDR